MSSKVVRVDLLRDVILTGLLAVACFIIGVFAAYLAIKMVAIFGKGMGVDLKSQHLYARTHIVVHVFGTVSAVLIVAFYNSRHYLLASLAIGAVVLCGGYSIINMIGFTSTNRVSVAAAKRAANDADERQFQMLRKNKQDAIKWAESTLVSVDSPRERKRLEAALTTLRAELDAIKPPKPTAENVYADPQATLFAKLSGWTAENWQMVLPIPVAVLIYGAEVLSFIFGTHLLMVFIGKVQASASLPAEKNGRNDSTLADDGSESGGGDKDPHLAGSDPAMVGQVTSVTSLDPLGPDHRTHLNPADVGQVTQVTHPGPAFTTQVDPLGVGHQTHVAHPGPADVGQVTRVIHPSPAFTGDLTQVDPLGVGHQTHVTHPSSADVGYLAQKAHPSPAHVGHVAQETRPEPVPVGPREAGNPGSSVSDHKVGGLASDVPSSDASSKMSRDQVMQLIAQIANREPRVSTRQLARTTQWNRRTLDRMRRRFEDRQAGSSRWYAELKNPKGLELDEGGEEETNWTRQANKPRTSPRT